MQLNKPKMSALLFPLLLHVINNYNYSIFTITIGTTLGMKGLSKM